MSQYVGLCFLLIYNIYIQTFNFVTHSPIYSLLPAARPRTPAIIHYHQLIKIPVMQAPCYIIYITDFLHSLLNAEWYRGCRLVSILLKLNCKNATYYYSHNHSRDFIFKRRYPSVDTEEENT